jgi:hypothetical protein
MVAPQALAKDDERERRSTVLLLDDRSAVGAGAAPPQKQRSRERRLRPAVQLVVQLSTAEAGRLRRSCLIARATLRELPPIARARGAYAPDATAPAEWVTALVLIALPFAA